MSNEESSRPVASGGTFSFYEDAARLDQYLNHRHQPVSSPNLVMEEPAFLQAAGSVTGKRVLDLGCGDGHFGRHCVWQRCESYLGIDGARGMIDRAQRTATPDREHYAVADMASFEPTPQAFDLVVSRLALHYLPDISVVLKQSHRALVPDGSLIITVLHPVLTSGSTTSTAQRQSLEVDNYFSPGPRVREWFGAPVTWHHRTIESYISELSAAGFVLSDLRECEPVESAFDGNSEEYTRRRRVPLFLLLVGTRA